MAISVATSTGAALGGALPGGQAVAQLVVAPACPASVVRTHVTWGPATALSNCNLEVVAGASLTLLGGAVFSNGQMSLDNGSSLRLAGTAQHPVRMPGSTLKTAADSSLVIDHAVFNQDGGNNGNNDVWELNCGNPGGSARATITSSVFDAGVALGNCDTAGGDHFTVVGNTFRVPLGDTALQVTEGFKGTDSSLPPGDVLDVHGNVFVPTAPRAGNSAQKGYPEVSVDAWPLSGLDLSGPGSNRLDGYGLGNMVQLTDTEVPPGTSWKFSPASGAVLQPAATALNAPGVAVDGTLDLVAGSRLEVSGTVGVELGNHGTLHINGTAAHPVTLAAGPGGRYETAIAVDEGSHAYVHDAVAGGGWYAFDMYCNVKPRPGGVFEMTGSVMKEQVELGDCDGTQTGYQPDLARNVFDHAAKASGNFAAGGGYDPAALQPALLLYNIDPTSVALSGAGANRFQGHGANQVLLLAGDTVPAGRGWAVSASSGAVLEMAGDTDYLNNPPLTVKGVLDLGPGMAVKSVASPGIDVSKGGALNARGSASHPVVFTSVTDDRVAGDSNGDGSSTKPVSGAYGTAVQFDHWSGGPTPITNAVFKYASTAISFGFMSHDATIYRTDFTGDGAAIAVEETSGGDYSGLGNIPCVPPYFFGVTAQDSWFAPSGVPAPSISLSSLVGVVFPKLIPKIPGLVTKSFFKFSGLSRMYALEKLHSGDDTVPWSIWSCAPPITPVPVRVPVTAVWLDGLRHSPNFPALVRGVTQAPPTGG